MPKLNTAGSIQTFTGKFFDPFDPDPDDICIEDIAHALSMQCRFSGHTKRHYSVATHSLLVAELCPYEHRLYGLLHDAAEAYLVDLPRPIKRQDGMQAYRELDGRVWATIADKFGLPHQMPDDVKRADDLALVAEARALLHGTDHWDTWPELNQLNTKLIESHELIRNEHPPYVGEQRFLLRFKGYTK